MKYLEKIAVREQADRKCNLLSILDSLEIPYEIHDTVRNEKSVSNIVVSLNPSDRRLVIGAHWDSVEGSTGANDDGSSCAILIRLCELLRETDESVDLVFFDREEHGCLGSAAYIEEIGAEKIRAMVNLDMCGAGQHILISGKGNTGNPSFGGILTEENLSRHGVDVLGWLPNGDDSSFDRAGIPNISVCILSASDREVFRRFARKISAGQKLNEEDHRAFGDLDVVKTMHNGSKDSIDSVSQDAMDAVYAFIADGLK